MTTAIIGLDHIGSALARDLVRGSEPAVLAARDAARRRLGRPRGLPRVHTAVAAGTIGTPTSDVQHVDRADLDGGRCAPTIGAIP